MRAHSYITPKAGKNYELVSLEKQKEKASCMVCWNQVIKLQRKIWAWIVSLNFDSAKDLLWRTLVGLGQDSNLYLQPELHMPLAQPLSSAITFFNVVSFRWAINRWLEIVGRFYSSPQHWQRLSKKALYSNLHHFQWPSMILWHDNVKYK